MVFFFFFEFAVVSSFGLGRTKKERKKKLERIYSLVILSARPNDGLIHSLQTKVRARSAQNHADVRRTQIDVKTLRHKERVKEEFMTNDEC